MEFGMALLEKNSTLIIDKENPFKNDCLDRKPYIENLTTLIKTLTQPFVISIEGPWGYGKTTFIKMWQQFLEINNHPCLYFNAWENDYAADPLTAFLSEMNSLLEIEKTKGKNENIKRSLKKVQKVGAKIIRRTLPVVVHIVTHGVVNDKVISDLPNLISESSDEFAEAMSEITKQSIESYEQEKASVSAFKKELENFAEVISKENGNTPLVIFIDELDRCRPDYAIYLLERIKHLFNVPGVLFILSLDRQQLENSVAATYGSKIDANGYLARFIDYRFRLPQLKDNKNYVTYLIKKLRIDEYFNIRTSKNNRHAYDYEAFLYFVKIWFDIYNLSLRDQEHCFIEMNLVLRTTPDNNYIYHQVIPYLAIIKMHDQDIFNQLINSTSQPEEIIASLPKNQFTRDFMEDFDGGKFKAALYNYLSTPKHINEKIDYYENLGSEVIDEGGYRVTNSHIEGFLSMVKHSRSLHREMSEIYITLNRFLITNQLTNL